MNQNQLMGLLQNLISLGGGFALGHGYLTGEQTSLIGGVVTAVAPLVWTYFTHSTGAAIAMVAALPDVKKIQTVQFPVNTAVAAAASDSSQTKVAPAP